MAILNIPAKNLTLRDASAIADYLSKISIDYEIWQANRDVSPDATEAEILDAYSVEIERLKASGGYVTADVINIVPTTPNLDIMR
jgi:1,2-dihydroxy-3-keto-5-methylthiopentene dioxygenase